MSAAECQDIFMRVAVQRLHLTGFRNYEHGSLNVASQYVVLTGDNGAGKTNVLEALSLLSPGRGMRRAPLDELACKSGDGTWSVFAELAGMKGSITVGTGLARAAAGRIEGQRRIRINREPVARAEHLLDHLRVVWIVPAMDGLFTGAAGDRRRFLDRMVLAIDPAHARRVSAYENTVSGRNRILTTNAEDRRWLDAQEAQIAELGTAIAAARAEFVALLSASIARNQSGASIFPRAAIEITGFPEDLVGTNADSVGVEEAFRARLAETRRRDQAAGRTLTGPHRCDLKVIHPTRAMPAGLCSTGEQKALLVGLTLAHCRLIGETTGYSPVLLLDEIAAHLDPDRRAALFALIDTLGCQTWMTGTEPAMFAALRGDPGFVHVDAGGFDGNASGNSD